MKNLRYVILDSSVGNNSYWLKTWSVGYDYEQHKERISYAFGRVGSLCPLFFGMDFWCSPSHAIDSDGCLRSLLGFLTLKPGDTEEEYFEKYTKEQMAFAENEAEYLQEYGFEDEDDAPEFREGDDEDE